MMPDEYEKFPCYNHFPTDWLVGTVMLTLEQKGAFQDLLDYAWEQAPPCTLPSDDAALAGLLRLTVRDWRKIKTPIMAKFELLPDGRIRNPKQWRVYSDMVAHRKKRRSAGEKGNQAKRAQCERNAYRNAKSKGIANGTPPTPTPFVSVNTDTKEEAGAFAPNEQQTGMQSLGELVGRIGLVVNE